MNPDKVGQQTDGQLICQLKPSIPSQAELDSKRALRLEKKLLHYTGKAIHDFKLIKPGDRILVCVSGGKDSYTLLKMLMLLKKRTKVNFELLSFTLDQAQPGWDDSGMRSYMEQHHIPYTILHRNTYDIVIDKIPENKTYCGLCSRLRRGIIYRFAKENGYNKIALGHHRDDVIQSYLMSIMYNGRSSSMPPKLLTEDKMLEVIRPLAYCQETDIAAYAHLQQYPIIPCNLCGSQENLARKKVKKLIAELAQTNPKIPSNILSAVQNLQPSHLMDKAFWDFEKFTYKTPKKEEDFVEKIT